MKKIACLGVMMAASAAFADAYTWNGAGGAAWTAGENWLVGETPSAWTDGALSFADSHAATWAADATLNIVGTGSLPGKTIRFGTNSSGLTAAQLKQIRYNGNKVSLNGQGYLGGPQGFIIMVL